MFHGSKIVVVMPAYNAASTLEKTFREIPLDLVDEVLVTDDASQDATVAVARNLGLRTIVHPQNRGYGGNQKTCYTEALRLGADVVVMLHPDYQYTPKLIAAMATLIVDGPFDLVLGSRILGGRARAGGMPLWKYVANRFLTAAQNTLQGAKLSEYHTGYRAFSRRVLETIPLLENSDDFVFDNQLLAQALHWGFEIGEVSCPAAYFPEASSIGFRRSLTYGIGCLRTAGSFFLQRRGWRSYPIFSASGRRLPIEGADARALEPLEARAGIEPA
ncbi:MAG: glycosyltransferase family 2 protein [Deltaproteobacteria bacterium]|nr:glycosyltransferase family 2 protein [Deltaproteobacteria bacterium]